MSAAPPPLSLHLENDWFTSLTLAALLHLAALALLTATIQREAAPRLAQPITTRVTMQLQQHPTPQPQPGQPAKPQPLAVPPRPDHAPPLPATTPPRPELPSLTPASEPPPLPPQELTPPADRLTEIPRQATLATEQLPTVARLAQVDLDGDIDAIPQLTQEIKPLYPYGSRQRGEAGEVAVELNVTDRGHVTAIKLLSSSGYAALDKAACDAVRNARFEPARRGNRTVAARVRMSIIFRLTPDLR